MRILHFVSSLDSRSGGTVRAVLDLCGLLVQGNHDVTVVTTRTGDFAAKDQQPAGCGATFVDIQEPLAFGVALSRRQLALVDELLSRQDVVHVHGLWELPTLQLCHRATALGIPYVITVHGMLDDWSMRQRPLLKRAFLLLLGLRWLRGAAAIHFTASEELRQAGRWLPRGKGHVIPLAFDLIPFRVQPTPALAESTLPLAASSRARVLFLSRLHPKKGLDILFRAVRLMKRRGTLTSLYIAGDGNPGYLAELRTLASQLDLDADDIKYLGNVQGPTKLSLFAACDVLALPTAQENFGLVIVESLASGLPVVTTRTVDIATELEASGAVRIAERTPEGIAAALEELLAERTSLPQLGAAGRRWAFESFDPKTLSTAFERLYSIARVVSRVAHV